MEIEHMNLEQLRKLKARIDKLILEKSKSDGSVAEFRRVWEAFVATKGLSYYWDGKDAACAKKILTMLKFEIQKSGKDSHAMKAAEVLIALAYEDKWLRDNFMVCNVASQFNKIVNNARAKQSAIEDRFN